MTSYAYSLCAQSLSNHQLLAEPLNISMRFAWELSSGPSPSFLKPLVLTEVFSPKGGYIDFPTWRRFCDCTWNVTLHDHIPQVPECKD